MARMTLAQAQAKAAEAQRVMARLLTVVDANPSARTTAQWEAERRRLANGTRHELETLQRLVADLVAGLQGPGPVRSGQIGGQRQGGHDTSAAALALVAPKVGTQRALVLEAVRHDERRMVERWGTSEYAGLTDVDLMSETGLPANSLRPRRVELVDQGWLEDSGRRLLHNRREHVVWTLTEAARQTVGGTSTEDRSTTP